jgi:hypothetical protein
MQRSEEPAFDLRQIFELMSFVRPDVEGLLGEVTSIGLTSGETEAEPVKIAIIKFHQVFKLRVDRHIAINPSK